MKIEMIAFDLDGTLLTSQKELSPRTREALQRASEAGIELVPATGRFFDAMPEAVRALPSLHYAITVNGAQVLDMRRHASLASAEIPLEQALLILDFLDALGVPFDVVAGNTGYMERAHYDRIGEFALDGYQARMLADLRKPVDGLRDFLRLRALGGGVQKVQPFTLDTGLRQRLLHGLPLRFPGIAVSSSYANNVEINHERANKGTALETLAGHLGIPLAQILAFGDGLNDVPLLRAAGIGVAMGNAEPGTRDAARFVTLDCDRDGVAVGIERFCFGKES